ncbi:copper homeostasis protein [Betaproteobacteria bacterium]|nr:copper homeostasis protein [Betaproteobacteria bacterium]
MDKRIFVAIFACAFLGACEPQETQTSQSESSLPGQAIDAAHTLENSLSWVGVYEGTVPGANSAIHILLTLGDDKKYSISYQYVDKGNEIFTDSGAFQWNEAENTIILDSKDLPPYYRVGEGVLTQLDMSGNPITGEHADSYVLKKTVRE